MPLTGQAGQRPGGREGWHTRRGAGESGRPVGGVFLLWEAGAGSQGQWGHRGWRKAGLDRPEWSGSKSYIWGSASVALQLVSSPAVSLAYTCIPSLGDWPCWLSLMSSQEEWARADGIAVDGASPTEALASPGAPSWVSVLGRTQASVTTVPGSLWSPLCEVGLQLLPPGHANCQVHRRTAPVPSPLDSPGPRALVRA